MKTLITNIGQLVAVPAGPVPGPDMGRPPVVGNAALLIEDERIAGFGPASGFADTSCDRTLDAAGGTVVPGLVDCHTHVVFAGSREAEFVQRIAGASYIEILEAGGGIKNSVRALRAASIDDLVEQSEPRIRRMIENGTTTVEIKSGYGLSPDDEIKTLEAIRRLDGRLPIDLVATFLGAHTVPREFDGRPDDYIDSISSDALLGRIAGEKLAEFADVFCERGAFDVEQSRRFLTRCSAVGLTPRVHAEQITHSGSARLGVELGAASVDHLERVDDDDIGALAGSDTIPVVLPGCSFFLGSEPAPARRLIDAGLPLALATDCNPGSAMIESLGLIMSMSAMMLGMTPLESLVACTANAAAALRRSDRIGAIAVGHQADLLILDVPNIDLWAYRVGVNAVRTVLKRGQVIFGKGPA
ncbi:MAG: imidazolonepropionase [Planctomycetota bacterium]|nr:imidazolonepropionase [Planctomycetota bacterium]